VGYSLFGVPDACAQLNQTLKSHDLNLVLKACSLENCQLPIKFTQSMTNWEKWKQESPELHYLNFYFRNPEYINSQAPIDKVNWANFAMITGVVSASYTGFFVYNRDRWWPGRGAAFHFREQIYAKGFDKLGHFYATKTQAMVLSRLYGFSNISQTASDLLGAGIALSMQTLIEIKDGTTSLGGFDRYDQLANIMGVSWFYARERVDFLKPFNVRWMYYPSENLREQPNYRDDRLASDYNGQSYWVSMRVWDLLPQKEQSKWPRFVVPTAGISLNNYPASPGASTHVSYHLSLNPDFKYILPQDSAFGRIMTTILNSIHFPAPALEVHPDLKFNLIFYGQD
jgi:hypothetical protein